jgi:hypothetical protein
MLANKSKKKITVVCSGYFLAPGQYPVDLKIRILHLAVSKKKSGNFNIK